MKPALWPKMQYGAGTMFGAYLLGSLEPDRLFRAEAEEIRKFWVMVDWHHNGKRLQSTMSLQERRDQDDEAVMECNRALRNNESIF